VLKKNFYFLSWKIEIELLTG